MLKLPNLQRPFTGGFKHRHGLMTNRHKDISLICSCGQFSEGGCCEVLQVHFHGAPFCPLDGAGQELGACFPHLLPQILCRCIGMRPQDVGDEQVQGLAAEDLAAGAVLVQQHRANLATCTHQRQQSIPSKAIKASASARERKLLIRKCTICSNNTMIPRPRSTK